MNSCFFLLAVRMMLVSQFPSPKGWNLINRNRNHSHLESVPAHNFPLFEYKYNPKIIYSLYRKIGRNICRKYTEKYCLLRFTRKTHSIILTPRNPSRDFHSLFSSCEVSWVIYNVLFSCFDCDPQPFKYLPCTPLCIQKIPSFLAHKLYTGLATGDIICSISVLTLHEYEDEGEQAPFTKNPYRRSINTGHEIFFNMNKAYSIWSDTSARSSS